MCPRVGTTLGWNLRTPLEFNLDSVDLRKRTGRKRHDGLATIAFLLPEDWFQRLERSETTDDIKVKTESRLTSRLVVRTLGAHGNEFVGLDDVGGEVVAVDAAGIQADRFLTPTWFGRRPVAEENYLLAVIDVIPGRPFITLAISPRVRRRVRSPVVCE